MKEHGCVRKSQKVFVIDIAWIFLQLNGFFGTRMLINNSQIGSILYLQKIFWCANYNMTKWMFQSRLLYMNSVSNMPQIRMFWGMLLHNVSNKKVWQFWSHLYDKLKTYFLTDKLLNFFVKKWRNNECWCQTFL